MNTKALRQKILDLAIHGKLVPQDPNDEPASVLLERIRAEKERLIKEGKIKKPKKAKTTCDKPHYPYQLPEGWVWCKLIDCCHIAGRIGFRGYTKDDLVEDGAITLSPSNIVDGNMDFGKCTYISWDKYNESPEIMVQCGDILLVKTGSSYGKCAFVKELPKEATINPQFVVLKYIQIDAKYLTCVLQSSYARHCYDDFVLGTAIPTFTQAVLGNMYIPLPSITEQKSIVDSIKDWSVLVEQLEFGKFKLQDTIKQAKSKILDLAIHGKLVPQDPYDEPAAELLKRINPKAEITCDNPQYGKLPKGWCETLLGNIGTWQSGATPSRLRKDYYNGDIPWLKTGDLNDGFITSIPEKITEKALEETSVKLNPTGSVLIAMYGATIGKVGILTLPATTNQACCACVNYVCDKMFLFYLLLANRDRFIAMGGGGAQPNISKEKITNTHIPLPPLYEQQRIVIKIEELFAQLDKIEASL